MSTLLLEILSLRGTDELAKVRSQGMVPSEFKSRQYMQENVLLTTAANR